MDEQLGEVFQCALYFTKGLPYLDFELARIAIGLEAKLIQPPWLPPSPRKVLCNKAGGGLNYIPISAQAHTAIIA